MEVRRGGKIDGLGGDCVGGGKGGFMVKGIDFLREGRMGKRKKRKKVKE